MKLQEIIICQIKDREGFPVFLNLLEENNIKFSVQPVPEEVYEYAQTISCRKELISIKQPQKVSHEDECWSDSGEEEDIKPAAVSSLSVQTELWLEYAFPLLGNNVSSTKQNLIHTEREDFVLVRIFK